jgi:hypothetical protein
MNGLLRKVLAGVVVVGMVVVSGAPATEAQAAAAIVVNDLWDDCGGLTAGYTDMQAAVDAAIAAKANTILVCPGSYFPFVVDGANNLTIRAAKKNLPVPVISPMVQSSGRLVRVVNSTTVVIDGLKIDGVNFDDTLTGETAGITFTDSTGTVQNSIVTTIHDEPTGFGSWGNGIVVEDTSASDAIQTNVTIRTNRIVEIAREKVLVTGPAKATITGNEISGVSDVPGNHEGIKLWGTGAGSPTGSITKNTIRHVWTGVRLVNGNNVAIKSNTITDAVYGFFIEAVCTWAGTTANGNQIVSNRVEAMTLLDARSSGPTDCVVHMDNNLVSKNVATYMSPSGTPGPGVAAIFLYSNDPATGVIAGNRVIGNTLTGWRNLYIETHDTGTLFKGNKMLP